MAKFVNQKSRVVFYCFCIVVISCFVFCLGCSSVIIPSYIQDNHPYNKKLYATFDKALEATQLALEDYGYKVEKSSDPSVFERNRSIDNTIKKQTLLFTNIRQSSFFIGSRYKRINVYLQASDDGTTEIEIRYLRITAIIFKKFYGYRDDRFMDKIFKTIEDNLN